MSAVPYFCREVTLTSAGLEFVKLDLGQEQKPGQASRTITTTDTELFGQFVPGKVYLLTIEESKT